jgi:phosphoribosylformylglycinamidine synthase
MSHSFDRDGDQVFLLGDTRDEFGGSEWAHVVHGFLGGKPPQVDFDREKALADVLVEAARDGLVDSAHDLSDGGLFVALAESCLRGTTGVRITVPDGIDPFVFLFSESAGRAVVAVPKAHVDAFAALCADRGLPARQIGMLDVLEGSIEIVDQFRLPLSEMRQAWSGLIPELFS